MEGETEVLVTETGSISGGRPITCGLKDVLPGRVLARPGPCPGEPTASAPPGRWLSMKTLAIIRALPRADLLKQE